MSDDKEKNIREVDISKEMKEAYLQYSMSVIVGRALPDVRDGLKPVHRRVLYAMYDLKNFHDKSYKKSARVVGDVIGKYHPHGDTAVYDTIVRMAQDFSLRYPLVDGQGNFGSVDGDAAAAQRYTEVRMTQLAGELLEDLEKETVNWSPNYDESLLAPDVLPAKVPNLLINGSSGIAVGMATNIPPHNLKEVCEACIHLIENPEAEVDDLMQFVKGPDFPTAGIISGRSGILSAYKKGRGIIVLKAVSEIVTAPDGKETIVISEIPYQVNKAKLIESIAELVKTKRVEGIGDIRDESSREGMRIVVSIKKGQNAQVILNQLYKFTQLQTSYGIILLALNSRNQPVVLSLKQALSEFIKHRQDVVIRRCVFELKQSEKRAHILEGLKKALDNIDEIVRIIKASKETAIARKNLMEAFSFSLEQAQSILEMRLQRLTGLERDKIAKELEKLYARISELKKLLASIGEINKLIISELRETVEKYGDERRTQITDGDGLIEDEDLIEKEDLIVTMSYQGYIKRISLDEYRVQKRGGKGLKGSGVKEDDFVWKLIFANTHNSLLFITDKGKLFSKKVYHVPLGSRTSKGRSIANLIQVEKDEYTQALLPVSEFKEDQFVVMLSKKGIIKKTPLTAFSRPRQTGIIALTIEDQDSLVQSKISTEKQHVFIATSSGKSIRFDEKDIRPMGRTARGVRGIKLSTKDEVVGMEVFPEQDEGEILVVTSKGYGKRTPISEFRLQNRGGSGIIAQKVTDKTGSVVKACLVDKLSYNVMLTTNQGQTIQMKVSDISKFGRSTQGVRLFRLKDNEHVTGVALIEGDEDPDDKD